MTISIFYIVEPPRYSSLSAPLIASIRKYFAADVKLIGYCPSDKLGEIPDAIWELHAQNGAEIRGFDTQDRWASPYPHGNKILAALDDRGTDYSLFLDTDIVFIAPVESDEYLSAGQVCASPATTISWGGDEEWEIIYNHLGLKVPTERINLSRRRKRLTYLPYFNAGMIGFPELTSDGRRFADVWYDIALKIDDLSGIPEKRPYLDQMSLPPAIQASGMTWRRIEDDNQFILGGRIRGKPLPRETIKAIHYRYPEFLAEINQTKPAREILQAHCRNLDLRDLLLDEHWFA